ncbi:MAG: hypothetical protein C0475_03820 [Planctomyces sp.]|nr:hypothetical protein [Planctomyces sp.]MBA4039613.1 hypothetical protein [Planctomyces sp.]MBA4120371.1 hypothetical protein [Isosphaera sp.]
MGSSSGINPLWIGVVVLAGLIVAQLGRSWGDGAEADTVSAQVGGLVSQVGDYGMMTVDRGSDDLLVLVLDQRREQILTYLLANQRSVELRGVENLRELFTRARDQFSGRR